MAQKTHERSKGIHFYITTTLPYVNAPIHLGHATEIIRADAVARYKKLLGYDVFFNTGTDEHGMKIYESAVKAGSTLEKYTDYYASLYQKTLQKLGVSEDAHYIRTTAPRHMQAAQEFWRQCDRAGYIYKKNYQAKYCIGCEEEKTDSELVDGKCPEHDRVPELINEENYFFKLSAFGSKLLALYERQPKIIIPISRMNEMQAFIRSGLRDFSISRFKVKTPWGIPVPDDPDQVIYVWFEALVSYLSTLGWPDHLENFDNYWVHGTPTQYCGKDNTRFQGVMWQAMLMAAGIPATHTIIVDGFILAERGVKMSKGLKNVIDPLELQKEYGTDALRYFVIREFSPFEDTAVSKASLKMTYNANLANGLGNLASRVMKMASAHLRSPVKIPDNTIPEDFKDACESFNLQKASDIVWKHIGALDRRIQETEPFKLIKTDKKKTSIIIEELVLGLYTVARMLDPILPETSLAIKTAVKENKMFDKPLFPRKD